MHVQRWPLKKILVDAEHNCRNKQDAWINCMLDLNDHRGSIPCQWCRSASRFMHACNWTSSIIMLPLEARYQAGLIKAFNCMDLEMNKSVSSCSMIMMIMTLMSEIQRT